MAKFLEHEGCGLVELTLVHFAPGAEEKCDFKKVGRLGGQQFIESNSKGE
jgi:hypothetical protein